MKQIVALRLHKSEAIKYAETADLDLHHSAYLVLQTEKGQEIGQVISEPKPLLHQQPEDEALLTIVRKATAGDFSRWQENRELEEQAFKVAKTKSRELGLGMKIVDAHYTLDRTRVIVTYGAEGRVDFRPLLQGLGSALKCRVELRQVGDRDVARLAGGIGRCGRPLCCSSWMNRFDAVSIRMAKEQALPISAEGLAGACGRLRCCLRFEYEQYRQTNRAMPRIGEEVGTPRGNARVIVGHRFQETVSVRYEDDQVLEWPLADIQRLTISKN